MIFNIFIIFSILIWSGKFYYIGFIFNIDYINIFETTLFMEIGESLGGVAIEIHEYPLPDASNPETKTCWESIYNFFSGFFR